MKYVLVLLATLAFFGREAHVEQNWNDKGRNYKMVDIDVRRDYIIFCDRSTNIAYLRYTVYYNSNGQPARCDEIQR